MSFFQHSLTEIKHKAEELGFIAVDTEFHWRNTYYPILCVIQLGFSPDETYLLDVCNNEIDRQQLGEILTNPNITKILHDPKQDLQILSRHCHVTPVSIFDTRLAAGFCGFSATLSLQKLLETVLNVSIPKSETCSDWRMRPLSDNQVEYAKDDVRYLIQLYHELRQKAAEYNNTEAMMEEMKSLDNLEGYGLDIDEIYLKVKKYTDCQNIARAFLKEYAILREQLAQAKDIPRQWIFSDQFLKDLSLASARGDEVPFLQEHLSKKQIKHLEAFEQICLKVRAMDPQDYPRSTPLLLPDEKRKAQRQRLTAWLQTKAQNLHIDPGIIANRMELNFLLDDLNHHTQNYVHPLMSGWRYRYFGNEIPTLQL